MPARLARWWIAGILISWMLTGPIPEPPGRSSSAEDLWPRVRITDPVTRHTTKRALDGAAKWLSASECAELFSEFHDRDGRPLDERLTQLQTSPVDYLRLVYFHDGERQPPCQRHGVLAFTEVGSRIVYVCGRDFARAWSKEPREVQATLIHEMLHSLGLGENPPTPRDISYRVQKLCWQ